MPSSTLLSSVVTWESLAARTYQVASGNRELQDEVLVQSFDSADPERAFLRVAVFDPAQNFSLPRSRELAHRAVGTARWWLRSERDPLVALVGANDSLHSSLIPNDHNPLTTVVFADVRPAESGKIAIVSAGRCADGRAVIFEDGQPRDLFTAPMLTPSAQEQWSPTAESLRGARHAGDPWHSRRWLARANLLRKEDWLNPTIGLTATVNPELSSSGVTAVDRLVVATDGLDTGALTPEWDLESAVREIIARPAPEGMEWGHGDIACIDVVNVEMETPS